MPLKPEPRQSFKLGQLVKHPRLGRGVVVDEWGAWIDLDDCGRELPVNGKGIYEVDFRAAGQLAVNSVWLRPADERVIVK
jgi:hypothetical protein